MRNTIPHPTSGDLKKTQVPPAMSYKSYMNDAPLVESRSTLDNDPQSIQNLAQAREFMAS